MDSLGSKRSPATFKIPEGSRRTASCGRSTMSSLSRSSISGSDVHATISSTCGRSSTGCPTAGAPPPTRKPPITSFGFQPSHPVVSDAISTCCPSSRDSAAVSVSAIVVDARKHDETQRKQQQRKDRESGDEKGTRRAGDACHYRRVRIRGAKNGAHEGHNGNRASIVSERAGTPFH